MMYIYNIFRLKIYLKKSNLLFLQKVLKKWSEFGQTDWSNFGQFI